MRLANCANIRTGEVFSLRKCPTSATTAEIEACETRLTTLSPLPQSSHRVHSNSSRLDSVSPSALQIGSRAGTLALT